MKLLTSVAMLTGLSASAFAYNYTDSRGYRHWCQSSCGHPHFAKHFPRQARHFRPGRHYRIRVIKDRHRFRQIDGDEGPAVTQQTPVPVLPKIETVKVVKPMAKEPPAEALQPVVPDVPKGKENIRMIKPIVNEGRPPSWVGDLTNPWVGK